MPSGPSDQKWKSEVHGSTARKIQMNTDIPTDNMRSRDAFKMDDYRNQAYENQITNETMKEILKSNKFMKDYSSNKDLLR